MSAAEPDFLLEIDPTGAVIRSEGKVLACLGLSPDRLRGVRVEQLVGRADLFIVGEILLELAESGGRLTAPVAFVKADGGATQTAAAFRAYRQQGRHLFTRIEAVRAERSRLSDPFAALDHAEDLDQVLAEIDAELERAAHGAPALSVFSLSAEDDGADAAALDAAAEKMAGVLAVQARDGARAFRSGAHSVSVLHGDDFSRDRAEARVGAVVGPGVRARSAQLDLSEPSLAGEERRDLIDRLLSATEMLDFEGAADPFAPFDLSRALDAHEAAAVTDEGMTRETAFWAEDGAVAFHKLLFARKLPAAVGRSREQQRLCRQALIRRLERAGALVRAERAKVALEIDAATLLALSADAFDAAGDGVLLQITQAGPEAEREADRLTAVLRGLPAAMLDGGAVARAPALQRVLASVRRLEMLHLEARLFGDAPEPALASFQEALRLCAGRAIALYVDGVEDPGVAAALAGVSGVCVSGPAVWPELLARG
ncbi:MAG: hypothetical protein RIB45_06395 [Marivibrio sp.]|uniref:hypothetical protein n=1 Tax=Marivibrio sp. TaxID=2039719 RepID=UPI0032ED2F61